MNLDKLLKQAAARFTDKTALVMGEYRITYSELAETVNRIAGALINMGLKHGDRVATMQSSNPEFVTTFFGIMQAGGIAVPLDSRYTADELERIFADCTPGILIAESPALDSLIPELPRFKSIKNVIAVNPELEGQFTSYRQIAAANPVSKIKTEISPDDIAVISYTGGSTRNPHGVAIPHGNMCTEAITSGDVFEKTERDVIMAFALPMYHQFGLTSVLLSSIEKGCTIVIIPGTGRSIDSFLAAIEREKGTIYMGVPYIYSLMINVARREGIKYNLGSMRLWVAGGAPLPVEVVRLFKKYYGARLLDIWGQTESVSNVTVSPIDGTGTIGATGRPMPCWEIKIVDDSGREVPANQTGEIIVRGPFMKGIYNNPSATATVVKNGWLHTGDVGRIDEKGELFITARQRKILILKGQNIFPGDIEEILETHPKVAAVRVVGVPDLIRGETVRALIRLKPGETATEQEIRQYCQGRMADYKLPRETIFTDDLPDVTPGWTRPDVQKIPELNGE